MNENCHLLDKLYNTKLLGIYEDGCANVEIECEKDGLKKSLLFEARVVGGVRHSESKWQVNVVSKVLFEYNKSYRSILK